MKSGDHVLSADSAYGPTRRVGARLLKRLGTSADEISSLPKITAYIRDTLKLTRERTLSVNIPPGVEEGTRIRLAGEGEAGVRGANTARALISASIPSGTAPAMFAWNEYFAFNMKIDHAATIGAGSCAGCSTPVCIMLTSITLTRSSASAPVILSGATNGTDANYVTWQGGGAPTVGSVTGCPAATPTAATT